MCQDEQIAAQRDEEMAAIKAEVETLRQEKAETELTNRWMGIGYSKELAAATAKASAAGDMDTVFKNHAKFLADREKELKAEMLKNTPTPPAGDGDKKTTKEDFAKMSLVEKQKFATENPDAYKEIYSIKEE
jgi:Skp family chaperone for outer membrane proteins